MRLRISFKKLLKIALIAFSVGAVAVFFMFFKLFFQPWTVIQPIIIVAYVAFCIMCFIAVYNGHYYEIDNKGVMVKRLGKKLFYRFSEVLYINEEYSLKKGTIAFVTKKGDVVYLTSDEDGVLLKTMIKECKNCIDEEELYRRFPRIYF